MKFNKQIEFEVELEDYNKVYLVDKEYFISKNDFSIARRKCKDVFLAIENIERIYYYYTEHQFDLLKKRFLDGVEFFDVVEMARKNRNFKNINLDKVLWINDNDFMVYQIDAKYPLSMPIHIDYIEGVTEEYYDLDKARQILRKSPYVSNIEEIEIPYYNQTDDCKKAIEFSVYLPQYIYEKLIKLCKKQNKKYWSCKLEENLIEIWNKNLGILGLREAVKTNL